MKEHKFQSDDNLPWCLVMIIYLMRTSFFLMIIFLKLQSKINKKNPRLAKLFGIVLLTPTIGNLSGCAIDAPPLGFPPYVPAQKLDSGDSTLVRESIDLLGPERIPHIKCADNEIGTRGDLCKITPNGLKLMVPTTMKNWIAIHPGMGKVIIYDVKKLFLKAAYLWGLENTALVIQFTSSPDGEPMFGSFGFRLIPGQLKLTDIPIKDRRGNLMLSEISGFPQGGEVIIPLKKFIEKSKGIWQFGDGQSAPPVTRIMIQYGPKIALVGSPEITNIYERGLMNANMMPGGSVAAAAYGENIPGSAAVISRIFLIPFSSGQGFQ